MDNDRAPRPLAPRSTENPCLIGAYDEEDATQMILYEEEEDTPLFPSNFNSNTNCTTIFIVGCLVIMLLSGCIIAVYLLVIQHNAGDHKDMPPSTEQTAAS